MCGMMCRYLLLHEHGRLSASYFREEAEVGAGIEGECGAGTTERR